MTDNTFRFIGIDPAQGDDSTTFSLSEQTADGKLIYLCSSKARRATASDPGILQCINRIWGDSQIMSRKKRLRRRELQRRRDALIRY